MKPNILLITSDQQHWTTIGYNNPEVKTPSLDRLADQGMVFQRAYCPNPTCSPTRSSLITGRYPSQHGCYSLGTKLFENVHTVGEDFSAAGYKTALVGKAHFQPLRGTEEYASIESYPLMQDLDYWRQFDGPFYGFDHVELARNHADEAHVGQHYALWMEEKGCHNWRDYFQPPTGNNPDQKHRWEIPEQFHYSRWIGERTNALLESYQENDESFFLWASFFDPHPPYLAPEPWDTLYDPQQLHVPAIVPGEHERNPRHFRMTQEPNPDFSAWQEEDGAGTHGMHSHLHNRDELAENIAVYYGMTSLMDKYIGQILDKLDELGLAENTLVVFTSDHGHLFGQHGMIAKGPFHYEDLIRVPMIARLPEVIPAGVHSHSMQTLVDYAPTFLSLAGLEIPRSMTGVDQSAVWRGEAPAVRDHILVENHHQPTTINVRTYVDQRYKISVYRNHDEGELFDLQLDPGEINNLWDSPQHADLKSACLLKMNQAQIRAEPVPMPRIWGA